MARYAVGRRARHAHQWNRLFWSSLPQPSSARHLQSCCRAYSHTLNSPNARGAADVDQIIVRRYTLKSLASQRIGHRP